MVRKACQVLSIDLGRATVAIQGFGNAGSIAGELLAQHGARIIAVCDTRGGIHNPEGLDIPAVIAHKQNSGLLLESRICNSRPAIQSNLRRNHLYALWEFIMKASNKF